MVSALWNTRHERTTKVRVATIAKSWKIWQNHEESRTRDRVEIYCSRRWLVTSYHLPPSDSSRRASPLADGAALRTLQSEDDEPPRPTFTIVEKVMLPRRQGYGRIHTQARRGEQPFPSLTSFVRRNRIWGLTSDVSFLWRLLYPLGWMIEWQVWIIWMLRWTALWTMIIWFASAKNANHAKKRDLTDTSMRSPLSL